jgi:hypothetical protein
MTKKGKLVCAGVAGIRAVSGWVLFAPPSGEPLRLDATTPARVSILRPRHDLITITDAKRGEEIMQQLRRARKKGPVHACKSIAVLTIDPSSGPPIKLHITPGHRFGRLDVFYQGSAYAIPRSAVERIFELAEAK